MDIGVKLALKLYKTHEKYAKNSNKIHTYQTPQNFVFCLSSSKDKDTLSLFIEKLKIKIVNLKRSTIYDIFASGVMLPNYT